MRLFLLGCLLFIIFHVIRIDLTDGTIPLAFSSSEETNECALETFYIPVTSIQGDTIASLLALYPDHQIDIIERMQLFYDANPHLQLQQLVANEKILIPMSKERHKSC